MTWDEFVKQRQKVNTIIANARQTNIQCPECNEELFVRTDIVLASYPPQYVYFCKKCKWSGTA